MGRHEEAPHRDRETIKVELREQAKQIQRMAHEFRILLFCLIEDLDDVRAHEEQDHGA